MTERIPCRTEGCQATILPTTAAKTGGYCMPCHQEQERQKRQAYIEKHRRTVDLFEGLTDTVEVLKIMHAERRYDPLIQYVPYPVRKEELYTALSTEQAGEMLSYAIELLSEGDEDRAVNILLSLVCYRNEDISSVLPKLMERSMYHPAILYKDAPVEIRDHLLQQVEWDNENRNHILLVLAWIGDSMVIDQFREWRSNPPKWSDRLYVAPEIYTLDAGWELTENGERRDLIQSLNYAIHPSGNVESRSDGSKSSFLQNSSSTCPWCSGNLITLADVDTTHPALAHFRKQTDRLRIETCERCGCFGTIYMELDAEGIPVWSRFNQEPDYLPDFDPEELYGAAAAKWKPALSDDPRSPFYAAMWTMSQPDSQIGGHPSWVQDAEYPECPCCNKRMQFIGQVDWEDFDNYGEGIFYMFLCLEDRITATLYQQS